MCVDGGKSSLCRPAEAFLLSIFTLLPLPYIVSTTLVPMLCSVVRLRERGDFLHAEMVETEL